MIAFLLSQIGKIKAAISTINGKIGSTTGYIDGADEGITSYGRWVYSKSDNTVRIYLIARSASDIGLSSVLGEIPEGYRPSDNIALYGSMTLSSGTTAVYYGSVNSSGKIKQSLSTSAREILLVGEYPL